MTYISLEAFENKEKLPGWLQKIAIAASLSVAIHLVMIYVKYGDIFRTYNFTSAIELFFTFFYFLSLFWIYPKITKLIHSLNRMNSWLVNIIEGIIVIFATFLLTAVTKILPIWIILLILNAQYDNMNLEFDFDAVRQNLVVHAILGLFFYYFVERERIRKQVRAQYLRHAELQREEFHAQLEKLKSKVNPHFLFSSLDFLDDLIMKDPNQAFEYISRLSSLYRSFLDKKDQTIPLVQELKAAEDYFFILNLRFQGRVDIDIEISEEYAAYQIPPDTIRFITEKLIEAFDTTQEDYSSLKIRSKKDTLTIEASNVSFKKGNSESFLDFPEIKNRYLFLTERTIIVLRECDKVRVELPLLTGQI